jgi:hypothetical protein
MLKIPSKCEGNTSLGKIYYSPVPPALLLHDCWQDCQRAVVDESGFFSCQYHSTSGLYAYIIWEMNNRPVGGRSSDMINNSFSGSDCREYEDNLGCCAV